MLLLTFVWLYPKFPHKNKNLKTKILTNFLIEQNYKNNFILKY